MQRRRGLVDRFLDPGVVAAVVAFHPSAQVALREILQHGAGFVHGRQNRIERVIHPLDDLAEVTLVAAGIRAGGELALDRGACQSIDILDQAADGSDAGVQVVLDGVEVTVVAVADLGAGCRPWRCGRR